MRKTTEKSPGLGPTNVGHRGAVNRTIVLTGLLKLVTNAVLQSKGVQYTKRIAKQVI